MNQRTVSYPAGGHGQFLAMAINILSIDNLEFRITTKTFDLVEYSDNKNLVCSPRALSPKDLICKATLVGYPDDIGIVIDDEILYLHQMICRVDANNYDLIEFEKNFIPYCQKHGVLQHVIDDFIIMNKKIYPNHDPKKLKWFYKNKIFGVILGNDAWRDAYDSTHKFPFSAFYDRQKFCYYITKIVPEAKLEKVHSLYQSFHQNVRYNPGNIANTGSILYESWQEYMVDRKP